MFFPSVSEISMAKVQGHRSYSQKTFFLNFLEMHKCVWYLWTWPDITTFEWWRGNYYEPEVDNGDNDDNDYTSYTIITKTMVTSSKFEAKHLF